MDTALAIAFGLVSLALAAAVWQLSGQRNEANKLVGSEKERADVAEKKVEEYRKQLDQEHAAFVAQQAAWSTDRQRLEAMSLARGLEITKLMRRLDANVDADAVRARLDGLSAGAGGEARPAADPFAAVAAGVPPKSATGA